MENVLRLWTTASFCPSTLAERNYYYSVNQYDYAANKESRMVRLFHQLTSLWQWFSNLAKHKIQLDDDDKLELMESVTLKGMGGDNALIEVV